MKRMAAVIVVVTAFTACAAGQAERKDPRSVLEAYVSAWNNHDFAGIGDWRLAGILPLPSCEC
jgi:hypothetical protein